MRLHLPNNHLIYLLDINHLLYRETPLKDLNVLPTRIRLLHIDLLCNTIVL